MTNASINSVSVADLHNFKTPKFFVAGIVSRQAWHHQSRCILIAEFEVIDVEMCSSIRTKSCLFVIPTYDMFLSKNKDTDRQLLLKIEGGSSF